LAQLETQVAAYNKQIEDLQETVIHRQEELKGFDKDREAAIQELNGLNKEYTNVQEMVNNMMTMRGDLQTELDRLTASVVDMKNVHSLAVDRLNEHKVKGG
jgi:predicted  nucleic acid-binding Zn-ribbon protein